ncbi:hypothetical protein [Chengkuizengella marina]|uniref:Uncharacterized protein n=1 Tax=Chengkuizengella marina TaxID=2507566 RepID=A0A6N9Q6P2_9BACL|nr:hypothetical protein [Chengkuizengella marina]NBI30450.1 hypothetical protein [Chengkuizengella marina]
MSTQKKHPKFEDLFIVFSNIIENFLLKIFLFLFIILIILQFLSQFDFVRSNLIKVEKLEGVPYQINDWYQNENDKNSN